MTPLLLAVCAAYGAHLTYTATVLGWRGLGPGGRPAFRRRTSAHAWLAQAGLDEVRPVEFAAVCCTVALAGFTLALAALGGPLPALALGVAAGSMPVASHRNRRRQRREVAREAWPRMIEEVRVGTGALGRSVPNALFEVGARGPIEMRPAFAAARREWLVSTDFGRAVQVLKDRLADPTADVVCETLVVAHELGGADLDTRLRALAEDRSDDVQGRKDARARQAGVRFARRFVLIVPAGMALAGMSVGPGRDAYATPQGQSACAVAIGLVAVCWIWAGRLLRLPDQERVFP